ncbi:MAG: hypothetical protein Q9187_000179 [Circinaria calcarea]
MTKRRSNTGSLSRSKHQQHISPNTTPPTGVSSFAGASQSNGADVIVSSAPSSPSSRLKRRREQIEDSHDSIEKIPPKKFVFLKPRLRYVNQTVIEDKWNILPGYLQSRVKELFKSIERPAMMKYRDDRRRIEAQVALGSISRTLGKRLPRMPFPPDTKETHFDYEAILHSNRGLELQLTPALHSTVLLQAEIAKEQRMLDAEKMDLADLKKNATAAETMRRLQATKRHKLLPVDDGETLDDLVDSIGFVFKPRQPPRVSETSLDPYLSRLFSQMQSHLESIDGNASQVMGGSGVLMRAHATLDRLLHS